jgi:hypothetical protein
MNNLKSFKDFLNEGRGYVETIDGDNKIQDGLDLIERAWMEWRRGPLTTSKDIKMAMNDLKEHMDAWFKMHIK